MKYSTLLLLALLSGLTACVQLTPAGERIHIISEDQSALITQCKKLGEVSVSSKDALRNASAAMSGDTAIISHRDVGGYSYIKGFVYDCSVSAAATPLPTEKTAVNKLMAEEKPDAEQLRKSNLCASKGGIWTSGQCVVPIE